MSQGLSACRHVVLGVGIVVISSGCLGHPWSSIGRQTPLGAAQFQAPPPAAGAAAAVTPPSQRMQPELSSVVTPGSESPSISENSEGAGDSHTIPPVREASDEAIEAMVATLEKETRADMSVPQSHETLNATDPPPLQEVDRALLPAATEHDPADTSPPPPPMIRFGAAPTPVDTSFDGPLPAASPPRESLAPAPREAASGTSLLRFRDDATDLLPAPPAAQPPPDRAPSAGTGWTVVQTKSHTTSPTDQHHDGVPSGQPAADDDTLELVPLSRP